MKTNTENYDFVVFILSHGRPDNVVTYKTLREQGYTGKVVFVLDDEDKTRKKYEKNFGAENVVTFSKREIAQRFDEVCKGDRRTIVYARNACFDIAERLGYKYFIELDDDYTFFSYVFIGSNGKPITRGKKTRSLDLILSQTMRFFAENKMLTSIAYSQGGDYIGGLSHKNAECAKRKAMNSFFCSTDRRFYFIGRINEDVNTYTSLGQVGAVFLQIPFFSLNQKQTQQNKGGMTDVYLDSGTYLKSMFSVVVCPSAVSVSLMGCKKKRIHHQVRWNNCCPKIIDEKYRKAK